jgi:hypothetical protein
MKRRFRNYWSVLANYLISDLRDSRISLQGDGDLVGILV